MNENSIQDSKLGDTIMDTEGLRWTITEIDPHGYRWCSRVVGKNKYIQKFFPEGEAVFSPKHGAAAVIPRKVTVRVQKPPKYPLDTYPVCFVIMCRHPRKNQITDDGILAYGFPGQPYPEQLLHRGAGMAFKTKEEAKVALETSLAEDRDAPYAKKCRFEIVPVYLPFLRRQRNEQ